MQKSEWPRALKFLISSKLTTPRAIANRFFNRDVQCVRRFFRKRFRYISDDYPKFREVVPVDREKRRHAAAEALRQNGKVLSVEDEDAQIRSVENQLSSVHHAEDGQEEGEELELDALVKASGFGAGSRMEKQLEDVSCAFARSSGEGELNIVLRLDTAHEANTLGQHCSSS